jgi:putative membrane protein insertion efficiency factor
VNPAVAFVLLVPRNLSVLVLRVYRAVISPLYGDVCRYYPSCSSYALQAIQQYGVVRGSWLGVRRIARCHPWAAGGVDDVPERPDGEYRNKYAVTRFGFVLPMATER